MGVDPNYYQLQAYGMTINKIFYAIVNAGTFTGWHEVLQNFGASYAANGYEKLSDGLTIQWGTVQASSLGYTTVTFPITFNTLFSVVKSSAYKGSDSSGEERYISWQNNAQFRTGYDTGGFNWIAIGI